MIIFLDVSCCEVMDTCGMENFKFPLHAAFDCLVRLPLYLSKLVLLSSAVEGSTIVMSMSYSLASSPTWALVLGSSSSSGSKYIGSTGMGSIGKGRIPAWI